jgi:soluble lytic murein transglycosylase-like protein
MITFTHRPIVPVVLRKSSAACMLPGKDVSNGSDTPAVVPANDPQQEDWWYYLFKLFIIGGGLLLIVFAGLPLQAHAASHTPRMFARSQYVAIAQQDAINAGISPVYFVRQINLESGFNPRAVSRAGAIGIAQFMPGTAAALGINPWEPIQSLRAAVNLMASYTRRYGGNYAMALAAYNAGRGRVQHAVKTCRSNWFNCLPHETRHYISVIMG